MISDRRQPKFGQRPRLLDLDPIVSEKPVKSDDLVSARSEGAHGKRKVIRKADTHQSWADMVKSRPLTQQMGAFNRSTRDELILSL